MTTFSPDAIAATKQRLYDQFAALTEAADPTTLIEQLYAPQAEWRGSHPINELKGVEAINAEVWQPLKQAFPDLERRDLLVIGGQFKFDSDGDWLVGMMGHLTGTFSNPWLGIKPTDGNVHIRYGEVHKIDPETGLIVQTTCLLDVLDLVRRAGFWPLPPSLGAEGLWTGPIAGDGLNFAPTDQAQSQESLRYSLEMQGVLGEYSRVVDRKGLMTMPQKDCWHPKMMWYGPSGVGTTRGLAGFVDYHQIPFRKAFLGRTGGVEIGDRPDAPHPNVGHYVRIGDGRYAMTGGWPSVSSLHEGDDWLGLPATGKRIAMRVMDFYAMDHGDQPHLIRENWVPIDMINILLQMGVDVMARVRTQLK